MMLRSLVVICALVVSACGQTVVTPAAVTGAPSDPLTLEAACNIDTPGAFAVEPRNGNGYLSWSAVASAHAYEVDIQQVDSGAPVAAHLLVETQWEWAAQGLGQGPYRARVRAVAGCGKGAWSAEDVFILNRSGIAADALPEPAPPAPAPPGATPAPAPPVPSVPLLSCGTVHGHYVANALGTVFIRGMAPLVMPLALPAGAYRVDIETNDAGHRAGWQAGQTEEVVTVRGMGTTLDIAEAARRQVTTFTVTLPLLSEVVIEAGPHSVHGVCVAFVRL
jgi:hypothetical protein